LFIIETKEIDRFSSIILKGYVNHHVEICPHENCPLKAFKKQLLREKQANEMDSKKKTVSRKNAHRGNGIENNSLLLA